MKYSANLKKSHIFYLLVILLHKELYMYLKRILIILNIWVIN